jgi:hypothetical protein
MTELWLPIVGHEGFYSVSSLGRVRSEKRHRVHGGVMTPSESGKGYRKVTIFNADHVRSFRYVHDLVLETFVCPRPPSMEAAHGNGKRDDNRLENLRWDTRAGNHADKLAHGTMCRGDSHGRRKLSGNEILQIRSLPGNYREIADQFGVTHSQIRRIKLRENWGSLS